MSSFPNLVLGFGILISFPVAVANTLAPVMVASGMYTADEMSALSGNPAPWWTVMLLCWIIYALDAIRVAILTPRPPEE